jgi:hypothetical protein
MWKLKSSMAMTEWLSSKVESLENGEKTCK